MRYKRYVSILNLKWKYTWKAFTAILVFMLAGQGFFLYKELEWGASFEDILKRSHIQGFFITATILTVLLLISVPIRQRSVSAVDYTYSRLPLRKGAWHVMTFVHTITHFLILLGVQFGMVVITYQIYLKLLPEEAKMTQTLFLAFIRWEFLRAIFPITDIFRLLYIVVILASLAVLVYYYPICIQKRYRSILPLLVCGYYYINFMDYRGIFSIILSSVILVGVMIYMIFIGGELRKLD